MSNRKPLSKKTRFEVFKRDRFTCQYCGAKAPEAVLHADHIRPVVDGGDDSILNLITACAGCNLGKGARKLDDRSVVEKQRSQIEELEERREQLEMMLEWRDLAEQQKTDTVGEVASRIGQRGGFEPNENGKSDVRRWLAKYELDELLTAVDEAFDHYMRFVGDEPDSAAWNTAFAKIPAFASMNRQSKDKPYLPRLLYIQGILRKRSGERRMNCVAALEQMILEDFVEADDLERLAIQADDWDHFCELETAFVRRGNR